MLEITQKGFSKDTAAEIGTRFVVGNGHLGYRGTPEEAEYEELPGLNIIGFYDQRKDLWRESVNMPNPFYIRIWIDGKQLSIYDFYIKHGQSIDFEKGIYKRKTLFDEGSINSERFAASFDSRLLCEQFCFTANKDEEVLIRAGFDNKIYEINGPHFVSTSYSSEGNYLLFEGRTNEGYIAREETLVIASTPDLIKKNTNNENFIFTKKCSKGETISLLLITYVKTNFMDDNLETRKFLADYSVKGYEILRMNHENIFSSQFRNSRIIIDGNKEAQIRMDYCIYLLIIMKNIEYVTSIPARGLSGQTYKGAIFWDTENFLIPFFLLTDLSEARNLLMYRINGLKGARDKAVRFGYKGAFYAWESQENGFEACSMFNVQDAKTGQPIRTYFVDKQIHISADVVLAFVKYYERTQDDSIFLQGGIKVLLEVAKFYLSYACYNVKDNLYHFNDVIGPDEYHERIDDNSFTNVSIKKSLKAFVKYYQLLSKKYMFLMENTDIKEEADKLLPKIKKLIESIYISLPNRDGIIEQFSGYFKLKDSTPDGIREKLVEKNQYWGGENGPAAKTKVIKQADVIAMTSMFPSDFSDECVRKNYDYYIKYTEHGSSLSSSMYALAAFRIGAIEDGYSFFMKSAGADLGEENKNYAGRIYIGGSHLASAGGAYLSAVYGMAGLSFENGKPVLHPHLPAEISGLQFNFIDGKKTKRAVIDKESIFIKEISI